MRRLLVALHGTRGDIQPGFAVAHALAKAGHAVTVLTPEAFAAWMPANARQVSVRVDLQAQFSKKEVLSAMHTGSPRGYGRITKALENESDAAFQQTLIDASDGMEAIVAHPLLLERAAAVAEFRGIPMLPYCTLPIWRTGDFGSPGLGGPRWGGPLNRLTHSLLHQLMWRHQREMIQAWRAKLGLKPATEMYLTRMQREDLPSLETYSETLCPRPSDWSAKRFMTGLVRPPSELRALIGEAALPSELQSWLDQGPPPFFITFGSQPLLGKPGLIPTLQKVLKARGLRAIFDMGWSPIEAPTNDSTTYWLRGVNHGVLLPRCAAAMHHGGAGSTAAAAEAGIPVIVAAAVLDQPFWAKRMQALGCGRWVKYRHLGEKNFADALDFVMRENVRQRAREVGATIAREDGLANVAPMLERALA